MTPIEPTVDTQGTGPGGERDDDEVAAPEAIDWERAQLPGLDARGSYVVLGATGAIGERLTTALVQLGCPVVASGRSDAALSRLHDLTSSIGTHTGVETVVADVRSSTDLGRVMMAAADVGRGVRGVVNCTGVGDGAMTAERADPERLRQILDTNVVGAVTAASVAYPHLRAFGPGASLVNTASIAAYRAMVGGVAYGPSKAAVVRLTQQLAIEWGPSGVRANCVSPGQTPTAIRALDDVPGTPPKPQGGGRGSKPSDVPLGRLGTLDDYVGPVLFLLSDLARYLNGIDIVVDGGLAWRRFAASG